MEKLLDLVKTILGGKKLAVCLLVFIASVVFFAVSLLGEDNFVSLSKFLVLVAVGANLGGMGIHAFAKNPVGATEKKKLG